MTSQLVIDAVASGARLEKACEVVGLSAKTVRRWLKSGVLPFHRLGRQIRIAEADLLAFLADRRQG